MDRFLVVSLSLLGSICCTSATAALSISVGSHQLDQVGGQTIEITVGGGDGVAGFDLVLQVGDGATGPRVTAIDLESGIFAGNSTGQTDNGSEDRLQFHSITTGSGTVLADGLLVRITLDASDTPAGAYQLLLDNVQFDLSAFASTFYDTHGNALPTDISNGWLEVVDSSVPEPACVAFAGAACLLILQRRRPRAA